MRAWGDDMRRVAGGTLVGVAVLALAMGASAAGAQSATLTDGTYMVQGGSYSIDVKKDGANIVIVEPNKTSEYQYHPEAGDYEFYNANTDATYTIAVIDDHTIAAGKKVPGNQPTTLTLIGGAPGSGGGASESDEDRYGKLAEKYADLAQNDTANIQSWTACSAVALKRSTANPAEADAYSNQMASMMKQILVDPSQSPCPEVMPF